MAHILKTKTIRLDWLPVSLFFVMLLAACASSQGGIVYASAVPDAPLPVHIPALPFDDNPDPTLCGIPEPFGNDAPGLVTGALPDGAVQSVVYLYDSHLRREITGQVYPSTRVTILLSQSNPSLDFYFVESIDLPTIQRGWVPAPLLRLPGTF